MALRKYRKALRYLDVCWEKDGLDEGEDGDATMLKLCMQFLLLIFTCCIL